MWKCCHPNDSNQIFRVQMAYDDVTALIRKMRTLSWSQLYKNDTLPLNTNPVVVGLSYTSFSCWMDPLPHPRLIISTSTRLCVLIALCMYFSRNSTIYFKFSMTITYVRICLCLVKESRRIGRNQEKCNNI